LCKVHNLKDMDQITAEQLAHTRETNPHWKGVRRHYSADDVEACAHPYRE